MKYIDTSKYKVQREQLRPHDEEFLYWIKSRLSKCTAGCDSCELMIKGSYNDKDTYEYFINITNNFNALPENNS